MKTVNEVSKRTGVSVRTLHHYDAIGLLHPTRVTEAGYRLYDDTALARLHQILLLRELEFPLKDIKAILDSPGYDAGEALSQQIRLLELRKAHLEGIIAHARQIQTTGVIPMDFSPFDTTELDRYAAQAKAKWGATDAYREYEQKTAGQTKDAQKAAGDGLMDIFREMGAVRHLDPASQDAQALVAKLQNYITANYYTCTKPILKGLGQMYIAGDSMTDNINAAGGDGTAEFANRAIEIYCK